MVRETYSILDKVLEVADGQSRLKLQELSYKQRSLSQQLL